MLPAFGQSLTDAFYDLLFQRAANSKDRINLSSGNPSFAPFQPAAIDARKAIERSDMQIYASGAGYRREKNQLLAFCEGQGLRGSSSAISTDNIVFGLGITHLYHTALGVIARKFQNDHAGKTPVILMSSPSYGLFTLQPESMGYDIETYPLFEADNWEPNVDIIEKRIREIEAGSDRKVAVLYNINPHNPTGSIASPATTEKLSAALLNLGVFAFDDLAYYGLEYSTKPVPLGAHHFDNSLSFYSCSKAFGMPRLRAGFACGPSWLTQEMNNQISMQMISLPAVTAPAIIACYGESQTANVSAYLEENIRGYQKNFSLVNSFVRGLDVAQQQGADADYVRKTFREALGHKKEADAILAKGVSEIELTNPDLQAGYFSMLRFKGMDGHFYGTRRLRNSFEFAAAAVDHSRTLVLPMACAVNNTHTDSFRITFGGMSDRRIVKGLHGIVDTIRHLPTAPDTSRQAQLEKAGLSIDSRFDFA